MTAANVATHSIQVAWTGQLTGIFTIGRSTIGGSDVLAGGFGANVFDDITSDVKSAQYERGRAGDGGNMQQGTYQVKLKDASGTYNPENPDSPLAPYLVPMRPIRHTADGPMVGGTALAPTFARASAAYLSDGSLVATGLPRYETIGGRQGMMVEEAATNLLSAADSQGIAAPVNVTVTAAQKYTVSMSGAGSIALSGAGSGTVVAGTPVTVTAGTTTLTLTPTGVSGRVQVENKAYGTFWQIGGTPRAAEIATIPTAGVLTLGDFTIEAWVYATAATRRATACEFISCGAGSIWEQTFGVRCSSTTWQITFDSVSGGSVTSVSNSAGPGVGWHYVVMRKQSAQVCLSVDGVHSAWADASNFPTVLGASLYLGKFHDLASYELDGLISDLRISSRARTDAEIAAAYASGTLECDADTTYKLPMDDSLETSTWGNQGLFYGFISEISHDPDARESTISAVDLYEWLTMAKPVIATMTGARVDTIIAAILDAVEWTDPGMRLLDVSLDTVPSWSADGSKTALALIGELLATDLGAFFIDGAGLARYINRRIRYGGATLADTLTGSHISRIKASVSKDDIINSQTVTRTGGTPQTATDADSKRAYGSRVGSDITSDYLASDSHANSLAGFLVALHKNPRVPARSVGIINGDSTRLAKLLAREIGDLVSVTEARGGTDLVGRVQSLSMDISEGFTVQQGRYTVDRATLTPFVIGESVIGSGQIVY